MKLILFMTMMAAMILLLPACHDHTAFSPYQADASSTADKSDIRIQ